MITKTGSLGWNTRLATGQLTAFDEGVSRVKPLIIFKGKGLRITKQEKEKWAKRVTARFEPSSWCHEAIMMDWIRTKWGNFLLNQSTPGSTGKILVTDVHRAQQTDTDYKNKDSSC